MGAALKKHRDDELLAAIPEVHNFSGSDGSNLRVSWSPGKFKIKGSGYYIQMKMTVSNRNSHNNNLEIDPFQMRRSGDRHVFLVRNVL